MTTQSLGTIDVAPRAIVTIVSHNVNQCDGVVGMASKRLVNGFAKLINRNPHPGIDVTIEMDGISITVYVIVEYGMRIRTVAETIQSSVKHHVEKAIGLPVKEVNVMVQGLRKEGSQL
jgi:uncharacterized alkaline shock family protein YloU